VFLPLTDHGKTMNVPYTKLVATLHLGVNPRQLNIVMFKFSHAFGKVKLVLVCVIKIKLVWEEKNYLILERNELYSDLANETYFLSEKIGAKIAVFKN
jgi:hypothetical protein